MSTPFQSPASPAHVPNAVVPHEPPEFEIVEPLCAVFRRALKAEGLKYTPERAQILDCIFRMDGLFEADQLLSQMKQGGFRVSKATVYRTIKLMLDSGLIQRVLFDAEQSHYRLVWGRRPSELLVRIDTQQAEQVDLAQLGVMCEALCRSRGLAYKGHTLMIFAAE